MGYTMIPWIGTAGSFAAALIWSVFGGVFCNMPKPPFWIFFAVCMIPQTVATAAYFMVQS